MVAETSSDIQPWWAPVSVHAICHECCRLHFSC